ncbi:MAG: DNA polymerase III subunit gamma/tau [bacterium]
MVLVAQGKPVPPRYWPRPSTVSTAPPPEPCDECPLCRRIREGYCLDVLEMDAASNRGIDEIRSLRDQVNLSPTEARYKVYIIDEVHMLTAEAFNAFLKTLEEPPERVVFVLATTEPERIPATILSRCQRFDFHRLTPEIIKKRLLEVAQVEGVELEERTAHLVARSAEGSMRDALGLLEQCISYSGQRG